MLRTVLAVLALSIAVPSMAGDSDRDARYQNRSRTTTADRANSQSRQGHDRSADRSREDDRRDSYREGTRGHDAANRVEHRSVPSRVNTGAYRSQYNGRQSSYGGGHASRSPQRTTHSTYRASSRGGHHYSSRYSRPAPRRGYQVSTNNHGGWVYRPMNNHRAGHAWVDGHWSSYGWVDGYWRTSSRANQVWVGGAWTRDGWVAGYWRPQYRQGYSWVDGYSEGGGYYVSGQWRAQGHRNRTWVAGYRTHHGYVSGHYR